MFNCVTIISIIIIIIIIPEPIEFYSFVPDSYLSRETKKCTLPTLIHKHIFPNPVVVGKKGKAAGKGAVVLRTTSSCLKHTADCWNAMQNVFHSMFEKRISKQQSTIQHFVLFDRVEIGKYLQKQRK